VLLLSAHGAGRMVLKSGKIGCHGAGIVGRSLARKQ